MSVLVNFGGVLFHKGLVTFEQARSYERGLTREEFQNRIKGISKPEIVEAIEIAKKKEDVAASDIEIIKPKKKRK